MVLWKFDVLIVCVNNYGVVGSIVVMVVREVIGLSFGRGNKLLVVFFKYLLLVFVNSVKSLGENCVKL